MRRRVLFNLILVTSYCMLFISFSGKFLTHMMFTVSVFTGKIASILNAQRKNKESRKLMKSSQLVTETQKRLLSVFLRLSGTFSLFYYVLHISIIPPSLFSFLAHTLIYAASLFAFYVFLWFFSCLLLSFSTSLRSYDSSSDTRPAFLVLSNVKWCS